MIFIPKIFPRSAATSKCQNTQNGDMTDYDGLLAMVCKPSGCRSFLRQDGTRSDVTQRRA